MTLAINQPQKIQRLWNYHALPYPFPANPYRFYVNPLFSIQLASTEVTNLKDQPYFDDGMINMGL